MVARPTRIKSSHLQFNEWVYGDLIEIPGAAGDTHWFLCVVDDSTEYCTLTPLFGHKWSLLCDAYQAGWLAWAGFPDRIILDNERGPISRKYLRRLSHSGTRFDRAAPRAPWQKGECREESQECKIDHE